MGLKLHLALLGQPEININGEQVGVQLLNKTQALLYYLASTGTAHSRTALAGLLWSDMAEAKARANLRTALSQLNKALPDHFTITRQAVQFEPQAEDWLDVALFKSESPSEDSLASAALLYRGEFLDDFHLQGAPLFDEWVLAERAQYHGRVLEMLAALVVRTTERGAYREGLVYARRMLALEPTLEAAHRQAMSLLAQMGERAAALAQYEVCRQRLQDDLGIAPSPETVAVYERLRAGDTPRGSASVEAPATAPHPTHNLPLHLTSFVGREAEIAQVKGLLAHQRLLTLTGIGGAGKTRLALEVADHLRDSFRDGIWLVELAPLADPALVVWAVASALSIREVPGEPILTTLIEAIRAKTILLILDNCEHLLQACAQLTEALLKACPEIHILATSREDLDIAGEALFVLPPLTLPELDERPSLEEVRHYEAVRLFSERAAVVQPTFTLTEQNATLVVEVCRWLDGLPLAIELAAARAKLLSLEQIRARLEDRFQLLTDGGRTMLPRQQTLRASIDWSYDLLSPTELEFFGCLSVFAGGWTLEAAEAVWAGESSPKSRSGDVLDLLTRLVDKSLVVADRGSGEETRYRLLETIRQYAAEKLKASGRADQIHDQHLAVFLAMAEAAETQLGGANQALSLPRLARELDNMRAALDWAFSQGRAEEGLRLAAALRQFWYLTNLHEGRAWLGKFLNLPKAASTPATRAKALHAAGYGAMQQDDNGPAAELLEASLALLQALNDTGQATHVLMHLAGVKLSMGELALAQTYYTQSLAVMRELNDPQGIMDALWGLGVVAYNQSEYDPAQAFCSEGLAIAQAQHDLERQAWFLRDVGRIALARGDFASAQPFFEQALTVSRQLGSQQLIAFSLVMLGKLRLAEHAYAKAEGLFDEALQQFRAFGEKYGVTTVLSYLGQAATLQGHTGLAIERYQASLNLLIEIGAQAHAAPVVEGMASIAVGQGQMDRAARLFGAAEAMRERIQVPLPPADRPDYERNLGTVKEQLSEEALASAWQKGRAMTTDEIIADVLG